METIGNLLNKEINSQRPTRAEANPQAQRSQTHSVKLQVGLGFRAFTGLPGRPEARNKALMVLNSGYRVLEECS